MSTPTYRGEITETSLLDPTELTAEERQLDDRSLSNARTR